VVSNRPRPLKKYLFDILKEPKATKDLINNSAIIGVYAFTRCFAYAQHDTGDYNVLLISTVKEASALP
jgi:hypothetical protein